MYVKVAYHSYGAFNVEIISDEFTSSFADDNREGLITIMTINIACLVVVNEAVVSPICPVAVMVVNLKHVL